MPVNLSIKEVPDALAERLRKRAARHHRSLQGELMAIIEMAAIEEPPLGAAGQRPGPEPEPAARVGRTLEQMVAAQRLRFPKPITCGPLAVDIIRADRDSR